MACTQEFSMEVVGAIVVGSGVVTSLSSDQFQHPLGVGVGPEILWLSYGSISDQILTFLALHNSGINVQLLSIVRIELA